MFWVVAVWAVATSPENIVQRVVHNEQVSYDGVVFVGDELNAMSVEYNTSASVSIYPRSIVKSLPTSLYTFRMQRASSPVTAGMLTSSVGYSLIAPVDLVEFSLVLDVYKTDYVFFGPAPPELEPHLFPPACTSTLPATTDGLDFIATTDGGVSVTVSHSVAEHTITDASVCGRTSLRVTGSEEVVLWIDCSTSTAGSGGNVLSGSKMNLGFFRSPARFCLYRANNSEIDHAMAATLVSIMFIFLTVWSDWTANLWTRSARVWETVSVAYSLINYQLILVIISMNIYARVQESHNIYSFSAMRMLTKTQIDATAYVYSYVATPVVGGLCLIAMSIGNVKFGPTYTHEAVNFTWGFRHMTQLARWHRWLLTALVLGTVGGIIYGVWIVALDDERGAIATAITTFPTVLHWSTPHWLTRRLRTMQFTHMTAILCYFAWGVKMLVITCLCNNLPFDVSGHLNTSFHVGSTLSMGVALLVITGRDMARILMNIRDMAFWRRTFWTIVLYAHILFVLWHVSIFNIGGMFSHGSALRNHGRLAFFVSLAVSHFIFSVVFSLGTKRYGIDGQTKGQSG